MAGSSVCDPAALATPSPRSLPTWACWRRWSPARRALAV